MGKRLVIKGADFSANGIYEPIINWYNNALLYPVSSVALDNTPAGVGLIMSGKSINCLRFYLQTDETDSIIGQVVKVYKAKLGDEYTGSETAITTYTITEKDFTKGYVTISWDNAVTLSDDEAIMIVSGTRGLVSYYYDPSVTDNPPYLRNTGTSSTIRRETTVFINIQYGIVE